MAKLHYGKDPKPALGITKTYRRRPPKRREYHKDGRVTTHRRTSSPPSPSSDGRLSSHGTENESSRHDRGEERRSKEEMVIAIDLGTNNSVVGVLRDQVEVCS